jgi:glycosyltransferase involved in cell wall biosynthesis
LDRTLLFLAYFFPPRGGAGVQRSVKFAKYLPQFGWKPLVIAHGGMADNASGVMDPTLLKDLPPEHVVQYTALMQGEKDSYYRAQKKWRQPFFATDPMAWWAAPAARMGLELAADHKPSAIFVTMSPFTASDAGILLKKKTGLPLVLDLRDPWALDETRIYTTRWHARRDLKQMHEALAAADLIIMNTPEAAAAARSEFGDGRPATATGPRVSGRIISITNGYDAEDFGKQTPQFTPPDVLRIVHTGMFHAELAEVWDKVYAGDGLLNKLKYPRRPINLWTRTPRYLLSAMEKIVGSGAIAKDKLELVLVGEISKCDQEMIQKSPMVDNVKVLGYRSHAESVNWVESADVLFLPLHTPTDGGPALVVPGKTYEYLGSGRPILAMGPSGDMRNFVQNTGSGIAIAGDDVAGAAAALQKFYDAKRSGRPLMQQDRGSIVQFERKELTARLADELNQLTRQPTRAVARVT